MEALGTVLSICKWFIEQKETNVKAMECLRDMGGNIERMHPVLVNLNTQGLEAASGIIVNLWQCLENAKIIYGKYIHGYSMWKPWVTPGCIKEKAEVHTKKVQAAYFELLMALNITDHNHLVLQHQAACPTAGSNAAAVETEGGTCDIWEIPTRDIELKLNMMGVPETVLGQGSFGVVGLGSYMGSPVAVKTAMPNVLANARNDSAVVRSFFREVKFMCTLDHPNICECHGAVTRKEHHLLMWIVMEKLDKNLLEAIMGKHLQHGRDAPGPFADMVAGLYNAVTYLHGADQGRPIVHRDLKPENIMLTEMNEFGRRVPKLVDFGESKETLHGVGSTVSKKGTPEWWSPEQKQVGGGCSTASDVYSLALVARFLWCGRRPSENAAGLVLVKEQTPHQLANLTLSLVNKCLDPEAKFRPSAAFVSHQLSIFNDPAAARRQKEQKLSSLLADFGVSNREDLAQIAAADIKTLDDLMLLEPEDVQVLAVSLMSRRKLVKLLESVGSPAFLSFAAKKKPQEATDTGVVMVQAMPPQAAAAATEQMRQESQAYSDQHYLEQQQPHAQPLPPPNIQVPNPDPNAMHIPTASTSSVA
jgi:serine/threonine protein kinase